MVDLAEESDVLRREPPGWSQGFCGCVAAGVLCHETGPYCSSRPNHATSARAHHLGRPATLVRLKGSLVEAISLAVTGDAAKSQRRKWVKRGREWV
jgi:hypothetical protein